MSEATFVYCVVRPRDYGYYPAHAAFVTREQAEAFVKATDIGYDTPEVVEVPLFTFVPASPLLSPPQEPRDEMA